MVWVPCVREVTDCLSNAKSVTTGLNNLIVIDLTTLHSSCMSLTVARMNFLLEVLSDPYVELGVQHLDMVSEIIRWVIPSGTVLGETGDQLLWRIIWYHFGKGVLSGRQINVRFRI